MHIKYLLLGFAVGIALIGLPVYAVQQAPEATTVELTNPIGGKDGTAETRQGITDLRVTVGNVLAKALGVVGSLAFLAFIVGGFLWLTSAGNADRVQKGSTAMLYATIGLFVIFGSYAILNTILGGLAQGGDPTQDTTSPDFLLTPCKEIKFAECPLVRCAQAEVSGKRACIEQTCSKQGQACFKTCAAGDDVCINKCIDESQACTAKEVGR